jgi:hypothetical protein
MWNVRLDIVDCSASLGCVTEFQLVQRDSCTTLCGSPSVAYSSILNTCTADHVIAQPPTLHRSCATMWQTARALPLDSMTCPPANISAESGATRKTIPKALDSQNDIIARREVATTPPAASTWQGQTNEGTPSKASRS